MNLKQGDDGQALSAGSCIVDPGGTLPRKTVAIKLRLAFPPSPGSNVEAVLDFENHEAN